jgi:transposase
MPLCCEMWPGNTTDVKTLLPIVERIRERFHAAQRRAKGPYR